MGSQKQTRAHDHQAKRREHKPHKPHKRTAAGRHAGTLIAFAVVVAICIVGATPLGERITQGLDLRGGVSVVMHASKADGEAITKQDMDVATQIVERRVNSLGASEATVAQIGDYDIQVQIPGATDPQAAIDAIGRTGLLEFVNLLDIKDPDVIRRLQSHEENIKLEPGTYTAFMTGAQITQVNVGRESETSPNYAVNVKLNGEGTETFAQVTRELAPTRGQIAIVLDGVVNSAPAVQSEIPTGDVSITGGYTFESAQALKTILDSGSLPVKLDYAESRVVGPTLGQDSLHQALIAIVFGFVLVGVYLFFFYRGLGLLTAGSLFTFGALYLGILAGLSHFGLFALSLPGIAGIVLTIGMAADSSILVLERFKEELRMGRSIKSASMTGVRHGIGTSIDADVVSLVSAIALFLIATGPVKGFGLTLALGILCDIITMLLFKAPLLRLLALKPLQAAPGFWGIKRDVMFESELAAQAVAGVGIQVDTAATGNGDETAGETSNDQPKVKRRRKKASAKERLEQGQVSAENVTDKQVDEQDAEAAGNAMQDTDEKGGGSRA